MATPKSPSIFRAKRIEFTAPEIEAAAVSIKERTGVGDDTLDHLDFKKHVNQVQELSNKLIEMVEAGQYEMTAALDALELVLKGGVAVSLGDDAFELLQVHLNKFHKELLALQTMKVFVEALKKPNKAEEENQQGK